MLASAIIPAAGSGKRFGEKKQFKEINGKPLIYYTLAPFFESTVIDDIVVPVQKNDIDEVASIIDSITMKKKVKVIEGGKTRQDSIHNALGQINNRTRFVCVHDAARPFITKDLVEKVIRSLKDCDAAIVGSQSTDTLKKVSNGEISGTIDRDKIWCVQTPQVFLKEAIINAYDLAKKQSFQGTDDSSLLERAGYRVKIINDSSTNFKITTNEDWIIAESLLSANSNV